VSTRDNGWQVGWSAGYLAGLQAAGGAEPSERAEVLSPVSAAATSLGAVVAQIDWARINSIFAYALTHGGNLPPGALKEVDRG
jgi:hypothetical protein